jgi:cation transport ATPase
MSDRILTPLEVSALKQESQPDIADLIATVEDAWAQRDQYRRLIDQVWAKFGEMSRLIREGMKKI